MFWIALPTAICTEPVACAWLASAALVAVTVQLPTAVPVTVLPNSVQLPAPAVSASVSAPLPLPPVTVTVLESPLGMLAGDATTDTATWLACDTVTEVLAVASSWSASAALVAVTVQVPTARPGSGEPAMLQGPATLKPMAPVPEPPVVLSCEMPPKLMAAGLACTDSAVCPALATMTVVLALMAWWLMSPALVAVMVQLPGHQRQHHRHRGQGWTDR